MGPKNQPEKTCTHTWIEVIKAIGPLLIVGTIIVGIWRFQVEREREAASRYQNIIRDLGNDSNSVRAGAIITMDSYLKQGDKINKKYREQGIYVLATHLAVEPEPLVRSTAEEVLVDIGVNDEDGIVVRKLACSNRHLWKQKLQDNPKMIDSVINGDEKVSKNLQSIADTMIEILKRRRNKSSHQNSYKTLDMSKTYLMPGDNPVELKGVELKNVELSGACLARMNFEKCIMENCNFKEARLDEATLADAVLTNVILDDVNLVEARCEGAIFSNTSLNNTNLNSAFLQGANLERAKLERADLNGANLMTLLFFNIDDPSKFQSDLNKGVISQDLRREFANNQISLTENAFVLVEEKGQRWRINDKDKELTYTIRKKGRLNIFTESNVVETELFNFDSNDTKKYKSDLENGTIPEDLQKELEKNGICLSENATISIKEAGRIWLINDKDNMCAYTVRKEEWLDICKETKFDFNNIKQASNWEKAVFDYDIWEKLSGQKD